MKYYVDTCIWLNLFKKEGDPLKGVPYWQLAQEFLEKIMFSDDEVIYSGFILKELEYNLKDRQVFEEKRKFLKEEPKFSFVKATPEDYDFARKMEVEFNFKISFFDCMHIALCKRGGYLLVTRDNLLIEKAQKYVLVGTPENLLP